MGGGSGGRTLPPSPGAKWHVFSRCFIHARREGGAKLIVVWSSLGGVPDGSVGRNIFRPARADFEGRKALGRSETRSEIAEIVNSDPRKRRHSRGDVSGERVGRSARPDPNPGSRERAGRSVGDDQTTINFAPPHRIMGSVAVYAGFASVTVWRTLLQFLHRERCKENG